MTGGVPRGLEVVDPGALTTVQDAGRPGLAHLGVPRSGWLDPPAARLANRLVGNPEAAAVLECLLGGLVLRATTALTVAVTGGRCALSVAGRPAAHGAAVAVGAGSRVVLGPVVEGLRCYVAVAGGVRVDPVLGSRASDTLSGLGPPPLRPGVLVPVGRAGGVPSGAEALPCTGGGPALRCVAGPRADRFEPDVLAALAGSAYVVDPDSDRVALRLEGPPLSRRVTTELPSEGLVLGAVQVPADGRPLVFLADHPTTGGYPVVAVVLPEDLPLCAQLRPGDTVRFRPLTPPRRRGPDPARR